MALTPTQRKHLEGSVPVTSRGALVGLLTMDNLGEFLLDQSGLGRAPRPRGA